MAALPYMPLYVADYLADTAHLTAIEHGAYLMLILNYWQRGKPLPSDDTRLCRIARVPPELWPAVKAEIEEFFSEAGGKWTHSRIDAELARVFDKSTKARASAQRSLSVRSTDAERNHSYTDTDTDTDTEEERKEGSPAEVTGGDGDAPIDPNFPKKKPIPKAQAAVMPTGWTPTDAGMGYASELLGAAECGRQLEIIRDWAESGGHRKVSWEATWRNWVRRASRDGPRQGQQKPESFASISSALRQRRNAENVSNLNPGHEGHQLIEGHCAPDDFSPR